MSDGENAQDSCDNLQEKKPQLVKKTALLQLVDRLASRLLRTQVVRFVRIGCRLSH
jgi:hypothetical protein